MSWKRYLIFLTIVFILATVIHLFLAWRLVFAPHWPGSVKTVTLVALALGGLTIPVGMMLRLSPKPWSKKLPKVGFIWMSVMFYLLVGAIFFSVVDIFLHIFSLPQHIHMKINQSASLVIAAATLVCVFLGWWNVRRGPQVKKLDVSLSKSAPVWNGFKIVQLSDVHINPDSLVSSVESLIKKINALDADCIVITGDLVDGTPEELHEFVAPFKNLQSTYGTFFVTGNHEFYSGAPAWRTHLKSLGMQVLENQSQILEKGGAMLAIAGIDDPVIKSFGGVSDISRALKDIPKNCPVVLLAHQPRSVFEASQCGVDLQLSGHTHGGQMKPFNWIVRLQQPFVHGLFTVGETKLYVSAGTGYWGPPVRVGTQCEITQISLVSHNS